MEAASVEAARRTLADALTCTICYEPFVAPCALPCGHCFDRSCLERALDCAAVRACPVCRRRVPARLPADSVTVRSAAEAVFPREVAARRGELEAALAEANAPFGAFRRDAAALRRALGSAALGTQKTLGLLKSLVGRVIEYIRDRKDPTVLRDAYEVLGAQYENVKNGDADEGSYMLLTLHDETCAASAFVCSVNNVDAQAWLRLAEEQAQKCARGAAARYCFAATPGGVAASFFDTGDGNESSDSESDTWAPSDMDTASDSESESSGPSVPI